MYSKCRQPNSVNLLFWTEMNNSTFAGVIPCTCQERAVYT